jgi:hypothetical protein
MRLRLWNGADAIEQLDTGRDQRGFIQELEVGRQAGKPQEHIVSSYGRMRSQVV